MGVGTGTQPKPATAATRAANEALRKYLNFDDRTDFENAQRGFIGKPETLTIKTAKGNVAWDLESYKKFIALDRPAPDTVNPSLWRNAQLCMQYGLFQVHDRIFQVRGYDLSNISFVQGDTGWIVFDPLISEEPAKAAYELISQHRGKRPDRRRRSIATHMSITTAACAALSTKPMYERARCRSSRPSTSPNTRSAKT